MDNAEEHGNRGTEREFGVSDKVVRGWRKQKDQLKTMPKSKRAGRYGVTPYKDMENKLSEWVLDLRSNRLIVTRLAIRARALQIAPKYNFPNFKASAGWCTRFMDWSGLTFRQKMHNAQKLPKDIDEKVHNFLHL